MDNIVVYANQAEACAATGIAPPERPSEVPLCVAVDRVKDRHQPLILEFGVASGHTLRLIRDRGGFTAENARLFAFDSWLGLPEKWRDGYEAGTFSSGGEPPRDLASFATLYPGWFDETLPRFLDDVLGDQSVKIDLLHVDCDLYSSTTTILHHLGKFIGPETVIVFDELFNYPGWEEHEWKALSEFLHQSSPGMHIAAGSMTVQGIEQALIRLKPEEE